MIINISRNKNGDYYIIEKIEKGHYKMGHKPQDELLIVGIPKDKWASFTWSHPEVAEWLDNKRDELRESGVRL